MHHDGSHLVRTFKVGEKVMVKSYSLNGPLSYDVDTRGGFLWKRHVDQIRSNDMSETVTATLTEDATVDDAFAYPSRNLDLNSVGEPSVDTNSSTEHATSTPRYPPRTRRRPDCYGQRQLLELFYKYSFREEECDNC